jgi:hypothetical protein
MNAWVLVGLVLVAGVAFCFRKSLQNQPLLVVLLIVLVLGVAARTMIRDRSHPELSRTPIYERSVGYALGQAAAQALPDGGELLVVRLRFDKPWAKIKADGYVDGLKEGLKGSRLKIAGVEPKSIFPGAYIGFDVPTIPREALMALLEREYSNVVGIVSFCGFPEGRLDDLPEDVPPLFVAGTHSLIHGNWLTTGRAAAMVVGRPDVQGEVDLSGRTPLPEVFDDLNYLVTADNLQDIVREMRSP